MVSVNKANPIGNLKEFIITCEAVGSEHMVFHWFKDDMKVGVLLFMSTVENVLDEVLRMKASSNVII